MERTGPELAVEEMMTSGASNRVRSIFSQRSLIRVLVFLQSFCLSVLLLLHLRHPGKSISVSSSSGSIQTPRKRGVVRFRREEEEDSRRRRDLAERLMVAVDGDDTCESDSWTFFGSGRNALFCRSWVPAASSLHGMKGILVIIHGLNEHSGRYAHFAKQLTSSNFGVYAMDWIGHGGSDGLHGYVPSLDLVVADTAAFLEKIKSQNPGIPQFLFGHSTGGSIVLKAASYPNIQSMLEGIILTSPALRVKPAHPIIRAIAPIFKDKQELQEKFGEKSRQKRKLDEMYDQLRGEYESVKRVAIQPTNNSFQRADPFTNTGHIENNRDLFRQDPSLFTPDTPGKRDDLWSSGRIKNSNSGQLDLSGGSFSPLRQPGINFDAPSNRRNVRPDTGAVANNPSAALRNFIISPLRRPQLSRSRAQLFTL